jgi:flagellar hook-associated protein 1 FlgK
MYGMRSQLLSRIEGVFGEPSDNGIASALDAFWNAWSDLASHPENASARTVVQQRALTLTTTLNRAAAALDTISSDVRTQIGDKLTRANAITSQIADLNVQIVSAETGGNTAGDLRDARDLLIDELAGIVPATVIDRADGSNQVMLGGMPLVDGSLAHTLASSGGIPVALTLDGEPVTVREQGGSLQAMIDVVNMTIGDARGALDAIASALVADVNALHTTGWSPPSGNAGNWDPLNPPTGSGIPFFDPTPANATARNIRLAAPISADAAAIAAGDGLDETGNNAIATAMARLRDFSPTAPGNSFGESFRDLVTGIGAGTRAALDASAAADILRDSAETRRASVVGVSTDEELLHLMKFQQAYAAAAKLVQVADEMAVTLLSLKS